MPIQASFPQSPAQLLATALFDLNQHQHIAASSSLSRITSPERH
jgi:hypothetical protein